MKIKSFISFVFFVLMVASCAKDKSVVMPNNANTNNIEIFDIYGQVHNELLQYASDNFIETKIPANKSSEEAVKLVEKFYMSLPLTDDDAPLIAIASAIGKTLWGAESNFSFEYADEIFFDQIDPTNIPEKYSDLSGSSFHLNLLETTRSVVNEISIILNHDIIY